MPSSRLRFSESSGSHAIARVRASMLASTALFGSWLNFSSVLPFVMAGSYHEDSDHDRWRNCQMLWIGP